MHVHASRIATCNAFMLAQRVSIVFNLYSGYGLHLGQNHYLKYIKISPFTVLQKYAKEYIPSDITSLL
jgi:hypothetical protein